MNAITVSPGHFGAFGRGAFGMGGGAAERSGNLTESDERVIAVIPEVEYVNGIVSGRVEVAYLDESARISVQGVNPAVWRNMVGAELSAGRYLAQGDAQAAVVGSRIARGLFKQDISLNRQISIKGQSFIVVGILAPSMVPQEDAAIFITRDAARSIFTDVGKDQFTSISVRVRMDANISEVGSKIEEALILNHRTTQDKKDFTVTSSQAFQQRMSEIVQTLSMFLSGIAAVSILVGAIGIANTMFMSVLERTRQIGVLKALGATNLEVMELFIIESGLLGFVGGVLGIFLALILSDLIASLGLRLTGIAMGQPLRIIVDPSLAAFALIFSMVVGMLSGIFPARRAAALQPVEALRYE